MLAEDRCLWLYAVTDHAAAWPDGELAGVGAAIVRPVRAAGLAAVVADLDQREFGQPALSRNLEDLRWLEQTARAHHAVIEALATHGVVVPMRLATVYSSEASVTAMLAQRAADFREALSRLAACSEWGVKAFAAAPADQGPAAAAAGDQGPGAAASADQGPPGAADDQGGTAAGPGAAYLRRRRAQLTARHDARREAAASARDIHEELCPFAVSARLYPPQAPGLTGQPAPMVLNAAYLVPDAQAAPFTAAVQKLTRRHPSVELALTGPWPGYSFVAAGEDGARDD